MSQALASAYDTREALLAAAADNGLAVQRIDQAGNLAQVSSRLVGEAERADQLDILAELLAEQPSGNARLHILPWAGLYSPRLADARHIHLLLNVNSRLGARELERQPYLPPADLTIQADLIDWPATEAPAAHQWPLICDRLERLAVALSESLGPDATLHVLGQAPLPVWMQLGFHFRAPGRRRTQVYQWDTATGLWMPWPTTSPGDATKRVLRPVETALDPGRAIRNREVLVVVVQALPYPIHGDVLRDVQLAQPASPSHLEPAEGQLQGQVIREHSTLDLPLDCPCLVLERVSSESRMLPEQGAVAADQLRSALQAMRVRHGIAPIRLFYAGPAALAWLIGTRLNGLGMVMFYNRSKDPAARRTYDFAGQVRA